MKSIEFLNTHATYKKERCLHNRSYLCLSCGALRRAPAHYVPDGLPPPQHCSSPMVCLSHEQTVAATHLPTLRRVDWMRSGGYVRERAEKESGGLVTMRPNEDAPANDGIALLLQSVLWRRR